MDPRVPDAATIRERLDEIRARLAAACRRAGRAEEEVTLIGVTKTFPAEVIARAREAGLFDLGENRVQELVEKAQAAPGVVGGGGVRWHMIGHLQRNKARDVVAYADVFHALDSDRLARELDRRAAQEGRVVPCLVQVNVSGERSKFGIDPAETHPFLDRLAACEHLRIEGLMTIAEPVDDPEDVRPQFRLLRSLRDEWRPEEAGQAPLRWLSMGMSGDYEVAVEEGATHVRIGSALFGERV